MHNAQHKMGRETRFASISRQLSFQIWFCIVNDIAATSTWESSLFSDFREMSRFWCSIYILLWILQSLKNALMSLCGESMYESSHSQIVCNFYNNQGIEYHVSIITLHHLFQESYGMLIFHHYYSQWNFWPVNIARYPRDKLPWIIGAFWWKL